MVIVEAVTGKLAGRWPSVRAESLNWWDSRSWDCWSISTNHATVQLFLRGHYNWSKKSGCHNELIIIMNSSSVQPNSVTSQLHNFKLCQTVVKRATTRCIHDGFIIFHPSPLPSQIQQMADNIAADIDKQLAAKTKELLGWWRWW